MLLPSWQIDPAAFTVVGMAGLVAGIAKLPVPVLIMVAEMTGGDGLLVPTMLVGTVTYLLTGKTSIYENQAAHRADSPAHRGEYLIDILEELTVMNDDSGTLVGMIRKKDLVVSYDKELVRRKGIVL